MAIGDIVLGNVIGAVAGEVVRPVTRSVIEPLAYAPAADTSIEGLRTVAPMQQPYCKTDYVVVVLSALVAFFIAREMDWI